MKPNANKIFSSAQEEHLATYAIKMADMFYGLPKKQFLKIAYDYAVAVKSPAIPVAWEKKTVSHKELVSTVYV